MYGYRCDRCGQPVNVDPGEERVCDECLEVMQRREKQVVRITYQAQKREVRYAG